MKVTQAAADLIPRSAWMRLRTGHGSKGIRHYDWAMLAITSDETHNGQHDGHGAPLVRRHRYTGTLSFYRCWSPEPVLLSRLIFVACARWRIEEDHQLVKQTCGLDKGQVIRWTPWHRWSAISLPAYLFLAVALARQRLLDGDLPEEAQMVPIAIPKLLRQLRDIVIPAPLREQAHKLTWSLWRRRKQYRSRPAHLRWHAYAEATP
ncbi:hypothetical protein [Nonomuraea cavernae]|uniref:hypothetical protein n=1 Tax=Nonomuraea cavernae TaxID=2045107 RepID=UPI0033F85BB4